MNKYLRKEIMAKLSLTNKVKKEPAKKWDSHKKERNFFLTLLRQAKGKQNLTKIKYLIKKLFRNQLN